MVLICICGFHGNSVQSFWRHEVRQHCICDFKTGTKSDVIFNVTFDAALTSIVALLTNGWVSDLVQWSFLSEKCCRWKQFDWSSFFDFNTKEGNVALESELVVYFPYLWPSTMILFKWKMLQMKAVWLELISLTLTLKNGMLHLKQDW